MTVVAVLHQPRYEIFEMFDDVLLLGKGGKMVYFGPGNRCEDYFERYLYSMKIPLTFQFGIHETR